MLLVEGALIARRYRLVRPLGRGGLATAWLSRDEALGRELCLKLLGAGRTADRSAFRSEFRMLAGLFHPHLARVHDFGVLRDGGEPRFFFTSEAIFGVPLDRYAAGRRFEDVRDAIVDVLDALRFLHGARIRHGDVKPDNVLVDPAGCATLIDLSCAARLGAAPDGTVSGSPGYVAPELARGEPGDARADLWSLGGALRAIAPSLAAPMPKDAVALVERLLRDDPRDRPADAGEVLEWLGASPRALAPPPPEPPHLLGRDTEMRAIREALARLERGEPGARLLAISGEPGSGRSRLLCEAKWTAQLTMTTVEGFARTGAPVTSMLARATGDDALPAGAIGAIRAYEQLAGARAEPLVLVLDDADEVSGAERETLEALCRLLRPDDPVLVVAAERTASAEARAPLAIVAREAGQPACEVPLPPLGPEALRRWMEDIGMGEPAAAALLESSGWPADLVAIAGRLALSTTAHATDLGVACAVSSSASARYALRLRDLPAPLRDAVATLAAQGGAAADEELPSLGLTIAELVDLAARGVATRAADGWTLARAGPMAALLEALGEDAARAAHARVASALGARLQRSAITAEAAARLAAGAALHLAASGDTERAERLFLDHRALRDADPRAWTAAAEALLERAPSPETRLEIAGALERGGRAARAREALEDLLAEAGLGALRGPALVRLAACLLELGDPTAALARLEDAALVVAAPRERAALADLASRALVRLGSHAEARARAEAALALCDDPEVLADLHEDVGLAASYLGERQLAAVHLARAAALHRDRRAPRRLVRTLSYQAIDAWRAGDAAAALVGYRQALAAAEEHGLGDLVARCSLNVGTACHQRGELGEALAAYERGARLASAMGQSDLVLVLDFDLAKLWSDVGAFERAEHVAERVAADAERRGARFFAAAAASILGECALARGDAEEAARCFERSRGGFEIQGAQREVVEEELELCRAHLARGAADEAQGALSRARERGAVLEAPDLGARAALLEGRAALLDGRACDVAAARAHLERALTLAERAAQPDLAAEVRLALADAHDAAGDRESGGAHRERARALWSAMARSLPEGFAHAFWSHPRRRAARAAAAAPPTRPPPQPFSAPSQPDRAAKLERLLAVFRRLNSSVETSDILAMAMDAAIDLAAAERGFLLLEQPGGELRVVVARNVDREKVGRSHLKFSRSIAERAIETQEPVVTVDAQQDDRFREHASVHAMRLRSVLAVPIRSPDGVLGALYLDNRWRIARFDPDDVDLLLAFADQVALALRNARLVEDLRRRTEELEAERARVEELMRGQAAEIDRLQGEVRVRQQALEHRNDYGAIVGRSRALQQVFSTLDRVIDAPVSVLVTGESGTGKELVARAIHFSGPRKSGPFVSINCAALPASLLESELFGHVRGAFTGADRDHPGLVVAARGGTLFLDELGEVPLEVQAKLLRVLQEREVRPLGSSETLPVDFRLVCATNRDLLTETARGRFREDLYYRVAVVQIALPPLRDRLEDLPDLARHFVGRAAEQLGRAAPKLSEAALRRLAQHAWPGNVRELENVITKALVLCDGRTIGPADVDLPRAAGAGAPRGRAAPAHDERAVVLAALERTGWNALQAARDAGMSRATFYRKLRRLGIERPR